VGSARSHTGDDARTNGWSAIASNHEAIALCLYLAEHEALGKEVPTFPKRALTAGWAAA
jgi:hypothetical protein